MQPRPVSTGTNVGNQQRSLSQRQFTARQTQIKGKSDRAQDARQIRSQEYINQCAERVQSFLLDKGYQGQMPSLQQLQTGVALKPFVEMINFLMELLDVNLVQPSMDQKTVEFAIVNAYLNQIQLQLNYPETNQIKQTDLKSISQGQTWKKFMLFLSWLVELTDYVLQTINPQLQESQSADTFIRDLCAHEQPESMLQTKQFYDFSADLYSEFLKTQGSEETLQCSLNVQFGLWTDDLRQKQTELQDKTRRMESEQKRLQLQLDNEIQNAKNELNTLLDTLHTCGLDLNFGEDQSYLMQSTQQQSVQTVLEIKQRNLMRVQEANLKLSELLTTNTEQVIPGLQNAISFSSQQIQELQQKKEELRLQYELLSQQSKSQNMTYSDFQKLQYEHQQKQSRLLQQESQLKELNGQLEVKNLQKIKLEKEISKICQELQLPQNLQFDEIYKLERETRKKIFALDAKQNQLAKQLDQLESEKIQLDQESVQLQAGLRIQQQVKDQLQQEFDEGFKNKQMINDQYHKNTQQLIEELKQLEKQKLQIQEEIQGCDQLIGQQQQLFEKENTKGAGELQKLVGAVARVFEKLEESRKNARNSLEMLRDKVGEALENAK